MRQLFLFFIALTILVSCSESFKTIDVQAFNQKIANLTTIKTPEELIKTYYAYPTEEEGNPTFAIQTKELGNGAVEITLIHEGLADDSQSGRKIVMTAQQTGQRWTVSSIKENWKCWEGRGHTTWGTEPCK